MSLFASTKATANGTSAPVTTPTASSKPFIPSTGTWKHPRFDEIARRQNATTFSDRNVRQIVYNLGGLVVLWLLERFTKTNLPVLLDATASLRPYSTYLYLIVRIALLFNVIVAILPLVRPKDDLSDIPLTPAQRRLLGLPPSSTSTPATAGSVEYVTPPRYPRSSTPVSGSPSSSYTNSPLSGRGSPTHGTPKSTPKGSPFSPNVSPLLHKAIGGLNGARRPSYGTPSPLGSGVSRVETPGTPSPAAGKGASVSLNSKWLYEKSRRSDGNARLFA